MKNFGYKKLFIDGSEAIARAVALSHPEVISAYPITPQTHIVEHLEKIRSGYEFIRAESEFSAASIVLGASAAGARAYTATSSQGLLLMTEILYNMSGLRLPAVITCANRSISGPINIWNDHSDAMAIRDSGWIMLFATNNQEALDFHLAAFMISELTSFPVMVNVDGFILTHSMEEVSLPAKQVAKQLLKIKPSANRTLITKKPASATGMLFDPKNYSEHKQEQSSEFEKAKDTISSSLEKIANTGLISYHGPKRPKTVIIAMGSICGTIRNTVNSRKDKNKIGLITVTCYRPFPAEEIAEASQKAERIIVLEKVSYPGKIGPLASDILGSGISHKKISGYSVGIGGMDVSADIINQIIDNK